MRVLWVPEAYFFILSMICLPRRKKKRLKDADKDYKDCLSILGNKWLIKS